MEYEEDVSGFKRVRKLNEVLCGKGGGGLFVVFFFYRLVNLVFGAEEVIKCLKVLFGVVICGLIMFAQQHVSQHESGRSSLSSLVSLHTF